MNTISNLRGYGMRPWGKLPPKPPANELVIRFRAQSMLTKDGKVAPLPSYAEALKIIEGEPHEND